ncbi:cation antiporter subunit (plasmid) [Dinoroseobacter shibae DFL 12 = DSM 16493]|jgi:multicomponent K+:H+ antiporter subunit E|uniref:Cation antiporter subunit n=1 Tax=Dinoroseobacter shibae (strain DSM 16493 / NCIMB 14021 / DFL 12) TaxID=398580 RepID=A8LTH1_DINSH|nr:Na+/H+ antiporter subunit E [Dinoroseobacter shibae]ABV95538.1 cation antiporter subunit [Dinoroseobacter shibae DFL 12 = DSM 16493]URF48880.1 Na+/H+ antiporter subunit E [Dinoroseobacter shibae]URF53192.1 Na+/H+ antiporter subunit E [Dinoroseobacter shibae]
MLARLIPHPFLSLTLVLVWLALVNKFTLGNLILGSAFGLVIPMLTAAYWPNRPRIGRPLKIAEYVLIVLWDIVVANVQVAMIILFKPEKNIQSHWIPVPVELTSAEAITVLAGTITMTPGTVSATLAADGSCILVHCLHTDDPDAVRDEIKTRYERRLKEIFA